jgi:hypothetical protein
MKSILYAALLLGSFSTALMSCGGDTLPSKEIKSDELGVKSPSDIRTLNTVPNSSLISNPISADQTTDMSQMAVIEFKEENIDFGTIKSGEVVTKVFEFTNTGKSPLVISDAQASCGCTVPEWPRSPIAPGETGKIIAKFDSNGKSGQQEKTITITSNTSPNSTKLRISGIVISEEPAKTN